MEEYKWHSVSIEDAFKNAKSRVKGLTALEAEERIGELGPNVLPQEKPYSK